MKKMKSWSVRFRWQEPRGAFEAGANVGCPAEDTVMQVVQEVAQMRHVDLTVVTQIEVEMISEYEALDGKASSD